MRMEFEAGTYLIFMPQLLGVIRYVITPIFVLILYNTDLTFLSVKYKRSACCKDGYKFKKPVIRLAFNAHPLGLEPIPIAIGTLVNNQMSNQLMMY